MYSDSSDYIYIYISLKRKKRMFGANVVRYFIRSAVCFPQGNAYKILKNRPYRQRQALNAGLDGPI